MKRNIVLAGAVLVAGSLVTDMGAMQRDYTPGVRGAEAAALAAQSPAAQAARKKADERMAKINALRAEIKDLKETMRALFNASQDARRSDNAALAADLQNESEGISAQIDAKLEELRKELGERELNPLRRMPPQP